TVVSELRAPQERRGSAQMLDRLAQLVVAETSSLRGSRLAPTTPALRPWAVAAALLLVTLGLSTVPSLGWPRLMQRFFQPLASLQAVTTTQLSVTPGAADVLEGRPLTIVATADRLEGEPVHIYFSDDG